VENVVDAKYLQDATRLQRCFNAEGVFDLSLPACGLPASTFSLQPVSGMADRLAVTPNQPGVPAGTFRYEVSPVEGFDPSAASGYGPPTDTETLTFSPTTPPYVITAVGEPDFDPLGIDPLALHTYPVITVAP
jgi:hypothetical protein